jgi:secreted trypsin-like serine protease
VDDCASLYQRGKGVVDPGVNLCAGDIEEQRVTCGGDSGGPLVDIDESIVGVVSWGRADCHPGAPGVFAKVSAAWDWINTEVCDNALDIPDWAEC